MVSYVIVVNVYQLVAGSRVSTEATKSSGPISLAGVVLTPLHPAIENGRIYA